MGNRQSTADLHKRKQFLEDTIVAHSIVIKKEHFYGAPDRNRIEFLKGEIEQMSEELAKLNKALRKK